MKSKLLPLIVLVFFSLFTINISAQIGVNTTTPDASSALDIQSTETGLLIPRMSTTERTEIVDPAHSLLVYDIDLDGYYFNQGTPSSPDWVLLLTDVDKRDNYQLVKSQSDLPDPAGGIITLDENTLYEINGQVVLTASIELNNAYIIGKDTGEDILVNATGGALFTGSTGGSFRSLTLTSSASGSLFDLSATASQNLIIQSIAVANFNDLGTVSNFGTVFFNVIQYSNNSEGITYNNIDNLLLNNMGWLGNNGGTYETFTGEFDLIEKVSGFSAVLPGRTGIDVSANPIVAGGVMKGTVFSGGGNYVNPYTGAGTYTGYNFTNDWEVDCIGIPRESDDNATGIIFIERNSTGSNPTVNLANDPNAIGGATDSNDLFRMGDAANGLTNNVLQYLGKETRQFSVNSSISYETTDGNASTVLAFYIVRYNSGGTSIEIPAGIESYDEFNDGRVRNVSVVGTVTMNPGDYVRVFAQLISPTDGSGNGTTSSRDTLRAYSMNLSMF